MFSWVGSVTTQILHKPLTTAGEEELDDLDHDLDRDLSEVCDMVNYTGCRYVMVERVAPELQWLACPVTEKSNGWPRKCRTPTYRGHLKKKQYAQQYRTPTIIVMRTKKARADWIFPI